MSLSHLLAIVVEHSRRRAPLVFFASLLLSALCIWFASQHLGVSTDTNKLFAASLPWRRLQIESDRNFPQFSNLLVAVIDARIPEEAEATAAGLAKALAADPAHFGRVTRPDSSPYLDKNGLMLLDTKTLGALLDKTIDAQPFLGQLVADPSARGLFAALTLVAIGAERGEAQLGPFAPALGQFHDVLEGALAGHPQPLSWESLLAGPVLQQAGQYRFVLVQPKLDYGALEPGGAATTVMRAAIARLPFVGSGDARVRITGSVALADEEFATVAQGALWGALGSIALVTLWLLLAVRSWRLIVPILLTLMVGLSVTVGFATVAVGTLNLISVAFAILFIGIAVDFAIQFSVRFRDERRHVSDTAAALGRTSLRVGPQILVAAGATSAGFFAFVPTKFAGVAELGLIAGVGMLVAFAATLVFLPAALTMLRPGVERAEIGFAWGSVLERGLIRVRLPMLVLFGALAVLGLALLPRITFDSDPLHTKDPNTEAMRTLGDLISSPLTNPYTADVLAPSQAAAEALATRLRTLPLVADVLSLMTFVPQDQPAKLALLADAANVLGASLTPRSAAAPVTAADLRMAAASTSAAIARAADKLPLHDPLLLVGDDLKELATAPDATMLAANAALVRFLPEQLDRLRLALTAGPVTLADIPPGIADDWRLPNGQARVQVLARPQARDSAGLHAFVAQVRSMAPDAGGSAVEIVETAATIVGAFRTAAVLALVAITVILALVLRRAVDVALVLAPLLLSALMTVIVVVLRPMPLNFANIIALPLLLGVGVSFNIYFVMNWRTGIRSFLGSATARAVVFSALTTGTAFGSLALSQHPGTSSMGVLLLISLGCTLVASLLFVPTLLARPPARPPERFREQPATRPLARPSTPAPAPRG